jgi:hypothetical protein
VTLYKFTDLPKYKSTAAAREDHEWIEPVFYDSGLNKMVPVSQAESPLKDVPIAPFDVPIAAVTSTTFTNSAAESKVGKMAPSKTECPSCGKPADKIDTGLGIPIIGCECVPSDRVYAVRLAAWLQGWRRDANGRLLPLDAEYDGMTLRDLLAIDRLVRMETVRGMHPFTPSQRAAISAHWSAELRAKITAGKQAERARVVVDQEDP